MDNRVDRQAYLVSNQPFTTADALSAGWSEGELRRAVRDGGLVRLRRGVLIATAAHRELQGAQLHRLLVQAELLALESPAAASHASAAFVYGMPLLTEPSEVELTSAVADARRRPGLVLRRSPLIEAHLGSDAYGLP